MTPVQLLWAPKLTSEEETRIRQHLIGTYDDLAGVESFERANRYLQLIMDAARVEHRFDSIAHVVHVVWPAVVGLAFFRAGHSTLDALAVSALVLVFVLVPRSPSSSRRSEAVSRVLWLGLLAVACMAFTSEIEAAVSWLGLAAAFRPEDAVVMLACSFGAALCGVGGLLALRLARAQAVDRKLDDCAHDAVVLELLGVRRLLLTVGLDMRSRHHRIQQGLRRLDAQLEEHRWFPREAMSKEQRREARDRMNGLRRDVRTMSNEILFPTMATVDKLTEKMLDLAELSMMGASVTSLLRRPPVWWRGCGVL